jgi:aminopeptidase 2
LSTQLYIVKSLWENVEEIQTRLENISRDIFGPTASEIGWEVKEGEPELNRLLRVLVLGEAGLAGDEQVISEAKTKYKQFIKGDFT